MSRREKYSEESKLLKPNKFEIYQIKLPNLIIIQFFKCKNSMDGKRFY